MTITSTGIPTRRGTPLSNGFVLRGVHALDEHGYFGGPVDVAVRSRRITDVRPHLPLDATAVDVDAHGLWLMPGVIDCHSHVTLCTYDPLELMTTPLSERFFQTASMLHRTLAAGVTYVRDAGGADAGVRDSLIAGHIPGPRLAVSVVGLTRSEGHGDGALLGPGLEAPAAVTALDYPGRPQHVVQEPDGMRAAVRAVLRAGADWVNIFASGGIMSVRPGEPLPEFTASELAVVVSEAAAFGRGVMAHALGASAVGAAVSAGVRSIEHGIGLTEREAALMTQHGVTLVPTLSPYHELGHLADTGHLPQWAADRAHATQAMLADTIAVARDAGVRIALGSDCRHRDRHGTNLAEITRLHRDGLSVSDALLAATANGARLCGISESVGRIAPRYEFDAILLDEDPGDLSLFERPDSVTGVFLGGVPVVPHTRLPAAMTAQIRDAVRPSLVCDPAGDLPAANPAAP
ncbi:metal-dependent hydrolase family protein [Candidatus Protofrankia californiensis]|uniref:metal-dependent hydrolase family protein n=1 Tax=Candidatus Protofrankia californiensis TaxID=1839754 RepID=UPI0010419B29|nr:amidohydrolase family protein [Candidatus Protofrankia californiensis]